MLHNACVDVPFPFKEGGGNGEVPHYAHENGCSTYLLFKSAPQEPLYICVVAKPLVSHKCVSY